MEKLNRAAKLVKALLIFFATASLLLAGRREIPLNQLTPEMLERPKRINILFFTKPVKKEVKITVTPTKMTIEIHYIQPKSFVNKLIRVLSDIDKNQKINGFESDQIYDYFHKEMTKNAILQINSKDVNCKTISQKIPDIYGPTDSREFEYFEKLECDLTNLIKRNQLNLIFLSDYVKLPAKQERFESPVEVTVKFPLSWKISTDYKIVKSGRWKVVRGLKLDQKKSAEIKFYPR